MIGTLDPTDKRAVVVGAGISGLLIAYTLKKNGFAVEILEQSSQVGGLIESVVNELGLVEKAAHSLLVTLEAKAFFDELGVELVPVSPSAKARYIYRKGKMRKIPLSVFEILKTLIRVFSKPKVPFDPAQGSLQEWGETYLGKSATDFLLAPFVTGVFATAPHRLLAKLAFPKLVPTQPHFSLLKHFRKRERTSRPVMMTPRGGMSALIQALASRLQNEIRLNHPVNELPRTSNLVLTVPTAALSKLIRKEDSTSAEALMKVPYAPLISVTCFFNAKNFAVAPQGVGVLIPRNEGLRMLGCLFNSSSFPGRVISEDHVSLTAMYGGTEDTKAMKLSDEELTKLLNKELHILLGAQTSAELVQITRWERAIPIYSHELKAAQDLLHTGFCSNAGRIVFSNFSKEVSIRGLINAMLHL